MPKFGHYEEKSLNTYFLSARRKWKFSLGKKDRFKFSYSFSTILMVNEINVDLADIL